MKYPSFFETVESITLRDPLAEILGAFEGGVIRYSYLDVVKNAGHSCPTMAGAYLMVREGLKALYPDGLAERGSIYVSFKEGQNEGVTGVIANIFSLITGATDTWGFKGLNGKFIRKDLMEFNSNVTLHVKMTRLDTEESIEVAAQPNIIPIEPTLQLLMSKLFKTEMNEDEKKLFGALWQARVEKILENFDKVIVLK